MYRQEVLMNSRFPAAFQGFKLPRGLLFGVLIVAALLAFEVFNYSTTEFALSDLLGELSFAGVRWATILAIAFCGIDFAGIARLFTPEKSSDEPTEVWYLFGAWLLAAAMNAMLTWWGVSIAILSHNSLGAGSVISSGTLTKAVPVFVAVMVWLIRVLIIGTFSLAGDRLFSQDSRRSYSSSRPQPQTSRTTSSSSLRPASSLPRAANNAYARPAPKPQSTYSPAEPTYHNMSFSGRSNQNDRYES
jgi:hypothetical protein